MEGVVICSHSIGSLSALLKVMGESNSGAKARGTALPRQFFSNALGFFLQSFSTSKSKDLQG